MREVSSQSKDDEQPNCSADDCVLLVLTTVGSSLDADVMARLLVEERLAACVSVLPVRSVYRWNDGVEMEEERMLLIKTRRALWSDLRARVCAVHPYDVPELVAFDADRVDSPYRAWLEGATVISD